MPRPPAGYGGAIKGAAAKRPLSCARLGLPPSRLPPPPPAAPALLRHAYSHPSCLQPIRCSLARGLVKQCVQGVAGGPETCWGLPLQGALHPTLRWQHAACSTTCSAWYDAHASSFTLRDELQVQVLRGTDGPGTSDLDYCNARALQRGLWQLMNRGRYVQGICLACDQCRKWVFASKMRKCREGQGGGGKRGRTQE